MKPITLMRLSQISDPDELLKDVDKADLLVSKKFDGFLSQVIKTSNKWKIYTRRGEDKTENMPRMVAALEKLNAPDNTFLIGEMVVREKGKDSISAIQSIMGSGKERGMEKEKSADLTLNVFDILWAGGEKLTEKSLKERLKKLNSIVKDSTLIKKVENKPFDKWQEVFDFSISSGGEGVIIKDVSKPYSYKPAMSTSEPRPGYWSKFKGKRGKKGKEDSDDFVVYDHEVSEKGKDKFKFGQYYKGILYGISEISNLSKENIEELKSQLKSGKKPVIEIGYQELVPGGLRHQKFIRMRPEKPTKSSTLNSFWTKHVENFDKVKKAEMSISKRCIGAKKAISKRWVR